MIICRAPFRISFFGGGTDYPEWYENHKGCALSTTINKYSYITCRQLPPFFDYNFCLRYFKREEKKTVDEIEHPIIRESLKFLKASQSLDLAHHGDLPARSGLGSSSAFTVCMLHSLYCLMNKMPTKRELALNAIHVERDMVGDLVGSQDQVAASFGGLNFIQFGGQAEIFVEPIPISQERCKELEDSLLLVFTGFARTASETVKEQVKNIPLKSDSLFEMVNLAEEAKSVLCSKSDITEFGKLLHTQWCLKKTLSSKISNRFIDDMYQAGIENGAVGGKLLGAGNGGFMLFFVNPENRQRVVSSLKGLMSVPFRFEWLGSQMIFRAE
ncbi:kinase [SAR116 cluster bacterium]|nr:kinase [SAR116 cluster bacterium]